MKKTRLLVLTAMFVALSVIGSFIKIPVPPGTPALDSVPAFISIAFIPTPLAAAAGALGHMATALSSGFPLTLPFHIFIALEMAVVVGIAAIIYRKRMKKLAWGWIILSNGVLSPLPFYFLLSPAMYFAVAPGILVATLINVVVGLILLPLLKKAFIRTGVEVS